MLRKVDILLFFEGERLDEILGAENLCRYILSTETKKEKVPMYLWEMVTSGVGSKTK